MTISIGILVFDGAEELDFVGPWEVFTMANEVSNHLGQGPVHDVKLIAEHDRPVICAKSLRVLPTLTIAQCTNLDVLLIPGGIGTRREATNQPLLGWIADCPHGEMGDQRLHRRLAADGGGAGERQAGDDPLGLRGNLAHTGRSRRSARQIPLCSRRKHGYRRRGLGRNRHGAVVDGADTLPGLRAGGAARHGIRSGPALCRLNLMSHRPLFRPGRCAYLRPVGALAS